MENVIILSLYYISLWIIGIGGLFLVFNLGIWIFFNHTQQGKNVLKMKRSAGNNVVYIFPYFNLYIPCIIYIYVYLNLLE